LIFLIVMELELSISTVSRELQKNLEKQWVTSSFYKCLKELLAIIEIYLEMIFTISWLEELLVPIDHMLNINYHN
jgi:hypothetical protein